MVFKYYTDYSPAYLHTRDYHPSQFITINLALLSSPEFAVSFIKSSFITLSVTAPFCKKHIKKNTHKREYVQNKTSFPSS